MITLRKTSASLFACWLCLALALPCHGGEAAERTAPQTPSPPTPLPQGERGAEAGAPPSLVRRVLASLDAEPLALVYAEDARALPERFSRTYFSQMLRDPSYANGAAALKALINHSFGADVPALWPDFSKMIKGPAVLAMLPGSAGERGQGRGERGAEGAEPDFRLVMLVVAQTRETAQQLLAQWPKAPPQSASLMSALRLRPALEEELPAAGKEPEWMANLPQGELCLRVLPRRLGAAMRDWFQHGEGAMLDFLALAMTGINDEETEYFGLGMTFEDGMMQERLRLEMLPGESPLAHVVGTLRENPAPYDALLAAAPGEQELAILAQTDFAALGPDLPQAAQALERYLRGRKFARGRGRLEEALDPARFNFLLDHLQGPFAIVARPALSGDLRLTVVAALKNVGKAGNLWANEDVEKFRERLIEKLEETGAEFETLHEARRIGASPPLGAKFQGRGLFTSPVAAVSAGWAWLCSNLSSYQDLTLAFKSGKTLSNDASRERAALKASGKAAFWSPNDAVRVQIDMEKVVRLAYAAWLLSGDETPFIGGWKVPGDLLPQPQMFNGRLGTLRAAISRTGSALESRASSAIPFASLILPSVLYEAADTIEHSRRFHHDALALEKGAAALPPEKGGSPIVSEPETPRPQPLSSKERGEPEGRRP